MLRTLTARKDGTSYILCPEVWGFFTELRNKTMNKLTPQNEQQEHMVQILLARMQGIKVCRLGRDGKLQISLSNMMNIDATYCIDSHELPITKEMWAMIDKKWQWAAMNENGEVYFYINKPFIDDEYDMWSVDSGLSCVNILILNTDNIDWRQSLTERPEGV